MKKNNPWFSFESDNDEIDLEQDVLGTDTVLDENAVDDAGDDSETVPVKPDTKKTAHNELASAGGVATSNNVDQLEVDPVVATESFMYKFLGLSREDLDETVDEITEKAETIPDADEPVSVTGDDDMDNVLCDPADVGTTVNITSPNNTHIDVNAAGDEVEVGTDAEVDSEPMSASDVAAVEGFRRLWSMEDDVEGTDSPDVKMSVDTGKQNVDLEFENKAVTIEPNEGGDDYGEGDSGNDDYGADEGSEDQGGEDTGSDEGSEEGGSDDNGNEEEGGDEETKEGFYFW